MNRRFALSSLVSGAGIAALLPSVTLAAADWCESDPPVRIVTPGNRHVTVHVTSYGELTGNARVDQTIRQAVRMARTQYIALPDPDAVGTLVTVFVTVPRLKTNVSFSTRSIVSTRAHAGGELLGTEMSGTSGVEMSTTFRLDVA